MMLRAAAGAVGCAIAMLLAACASADDGHPLSLWQLSGESNRVYLLGSVHLLRAEDYPLPAEIEDAYADAETLYMELDLDDLDPAATQAVVGRLGLIQDGRTLADWMGSDAYARAESLAQDVDIELARLANAEPWYAAVTVEQIALSRIGFDTSRGVEAHMLRKASDDGKDVLGLETLEEQLGFLDRLSLPSQRSMLLHTLGEATEIEPLMDRLIAAWRHGDVEFLERETLAEMAQFPELHDALVVRRNRSWTRQIEALLDDQADYLIIVGALHLVGADSVVAMLEQRGHRVTQLHHVAQD